MVPRPPTGGYAYQHGITTIYDQQAGGDVATVRSGDLAVDNFGSAHLSTNLFIQNVTVSNVAYRGIVISAAASDTIGNNTINQVTVNNVGKPGSQDVNRIGILVQNNDQGQVVASHVTNAGVGIASGILGTGTYSDSTMARNKSGMRDNVVTDAVVRGYSVSFEDGQLDLNFLLLGLAAQFQGFDNNQVIINSPANNAVGLYLNYSQPLVVGFVSTAPRSACRSRIRYSIWALAH